MKKIRENRYSKLVGASERQYNTGALVCSVYSFSLFCTVLKRSTVQILSKWRGRVGNRGNSDKSLNISLSITLVILLIG